MRDNLIMHRRQHQSHDGKVADTMAPIVAGGSLQGPSTVQLPTGISHHADAETQEGQGQHMAQHQSRVCHGYHGCCAHELVIIE